MEDFKKQLTSALQTVTSELETIAVQNVTTGDWVAKPAPLTGEADPNDVADGTEDWNERRALMAQLETRYHNIVLALQKFEDDTYGLCEICHEQIEADRLGANPAARTCKIHLEKERELPL